MRHRRRAPGHHHVSGLNHGVAAAKRQQRAARPHVRAALAADAAAATAAQIRRGVTRVTSAVTATFLVRDGDCGAASIAVGKRRLLGAQGRGREVVAASAVVGHGADCGACAQATSVGMR